MTRHPGFPTPDELRGAKTRAEAIRDDLRSRRPAATSRRRGAARSILAALAIVAALALLVVALA